MKNKLWKLLIGLSVVHLFSIGMVADAQDLIPATTPEQVPLTQESQNARQIYTQLMHAIYLKSFDKDITMARQLYDALVKQVPNSAFVWYKRAQLRERMQDVRGAEQDTRQALKLNPTHVPANWQLALLLVSRITHTGGKNIDAVLQALKKVTELDNDHFMAHRLLADLAYQIQEYATAENSFKALTRIVPYDPVFHRQLGDLYLRLNRLQEAIDAYQRVIKIDPNDTNTLRVIGDLYRRLDQPQEAIDTLQRIIQIDPNDRNSLRILGHTYLATEKLTEAERTFKQLLEIAPQDVHGNLGLGLVLEEIAFRTLSTKNNKQQTVGTVSQPHSPIDRQTLVQDAETYLGRAIYFAKEIINKPRNNRQRNNYQRIMSDAQLALANIYFLYKKYDKSEETFLEILTATPEHVRANYGIAAVYQTTKAFEKAETYLRKTLSIEPGHQNALNALGYLFAEQGKNLDEAEDLIKRALEKSPTNGAYLDSLGWVFFKQGRIQEAVTILENANQQMPDSPEILMHLGDAYLKNGEPEKAKQIWQQAQTIEPDNEEIQKRLEQ